MALIDIVRRGYFIANNRGELNLYDAYKDWVQEKQTFGAALRSGHLGVFNYAPNHFPRPLRDRLRGMGTNDPIVTERVAEGRTAAFYFKPEATLAEKESFTRAVLGTIRYFMDFEYEEAYENAVALRGDGQELAADW